MDLRLHYVTHAGVVVTPDVTAPAEWPTLEWLYHMVEVNPDVIFFYTTDTTDIF